MGSGDGFYVVSDDGFYVGSDDGFMLVLRMFHMTIFMLSPNTISSLKRSLSSESEKNCDIFRSGRHCLFQFNLSEISFFSGLHLS